MIETWLQRQHGDAVLSGQRVEDGVWDLFDSGDLAVAELVASVGGSTGHASLIDARIDALMVALAARSLVTVMPFPSSEREVGQAINGMFCALELAAQRDGNGTFAAYSFIRTAAEISRAAEERGDDPSSDAHVCPYSSLRMLINESIFCLRQIAQTSDRSAGWYPARRWCRNLQKVLVAGRWYLQDPSRNNRVIRDGPQHAAKRFTAVARRSMLADALYGATAPVPGFMRGLFESGWEWSAGLPLTHRVVTHKTV